MQSLHLPAHRPLTVVKAQIRGAQAGPSAVAGEKPARIGASGRIACSCLMDRDGDRLSPRTGRSPRSLAYRAARRPCSLDLPLGAVAVV